MLKINPKNILIIKLRAIGDVVLMSPVLENLRNHFPNVNIDCLVDANCSQILSHNPHISSIISFDKNSQSSLSIIKTIRDKKYDTVIDLFGNPRSAIITLLSGAKNKIGFNFRMRKYAYNIVVDAITKDAHNIETNLNVLRSLGIPITTSNPKVYLNNGVINKAENWLNSNNLTDKLLIGINVGGGWSTKKYLPSHYIKVIKNILNSVDVHFLILWGPGEFDDAKLIADSDIKKCHLLPSTSILELSAFISKLNFMISNDSGPMHISAALGIKTLGIFGPTTPKNQGPFGEGNITIRKEELDCLECQLLKCPIGNICMTELDSLKVSDAYFKLSSLPKVN